MMRVELVGRTNKYILVLPTVCPWLNISRVYKDDWERQRSGVSSVERGFAMSRLGKIYGHGAGRAIMGVSRLNVRQGAL